MKPVVVVHGGAGRVEPARRESHVEGCMRAAEAGLSVLTAGGTSLEAATVAVEVMEDDPRYNAGTGASLTRAGTLELDASVMEGTTRRAGAVAALSPFPNPVRVARAVLDDGEHLFYAGVGADRFAIGQGFRPADPRAMVTERSRARLAAAQEGRPAVWAGGTVGAVACSDSGRVAAATSTGGVVGQRPGRVGDTPVIGAGTYADDRWGASSTTGLGESIIRASLARAAVDRLRAEPLGEDRCQRALDDALEEFRDFFEGVGGLILVDAEGAVGVGTTTETMSFAIARPGRPVAGGSEPFSRKENR